jgi:glycerol-3-phosphate acyltransferase PlsY
MMNFDVARILSIVIISYLLGSLPTAYLIGRLKRVNIFEVGSGNMGSTNVVRAMGCGYGILTALGDIFKGIAAILIARAILPDNTVLATVLSAIVVIIGHNWSLFVALITGTLRGGKGAATAFGTMLMIAPLQVIAVVCVVGALLVALTRYVSLGVLGMLTIAVLWVLILIGQHTLSWEYAIYTIFVAAIMLWRFRGNIQRLLAGTERRLGERA